MRIIFLDIDGVLNTSVNTFKVRVHNEDVHFYIDLKILLKELKELFIYCNNKNVRIMLTSLNALNKDRDVFNDLFRKLFKECLDYEYVSNIIIDVVAGFNVDRGVLIQKAIDRYCIDNFVIVDDDIYDIEPYFTLDHIIKIDKQKGITMQDIISVIKYFDGEK